MLKLNDEVKERDRKNSHNRENLLVASIDPNGKIVYLNEECERLVGYIKNEILDKQFDFLIPDRYFEQWADLLKSIKDNKSATEFKLPWLTKDGQEIMASWSVAPVGDSYGTIGLVGKLIDTEEDLVDFPEVKDEENEFNSDKSNDNALLFKMGSKRVYVKKSNKKIKKEKPEKTNDNKDNKENYKDLTKRYNSKTLSKNYETIDKLQKSISELEEKNNQLEEKLKNLKNKKKKNNKSKDKTGTVLLAEVNNSINDKFSFLFNCIGINKKREEFKEMKNIFDEKKKMLADLEAELNKNKKALNKDRNKYIEWREKLELLEEDIELRREYVVFNEERIDNKLTSLETVEEKSKTDIGELDEKSDYEYDGKIDKIPSAAAIIQRGILKQVNDLFVGLLGYNVDMILEKNLFDFVIPEGFSGIEKYYLNRLKGENISSFETMFVTKNDSRIAVEVNTKPVFYKGEKAEIAVFKKLFDEPGGNVAMSVDNVSEKQVEEEEVSWDGKSQTEINDVVNKIKSKDEGGVSDGGVEAKSENDVPAASDNGKPDESAPVGRKMSQDAISSMFDKANEEKPSEESPKEESALPEEITLVETDTTTEEVPVPSDKTNQDAINAMVAKAVEEPAKETAPDDKTLEKSENQEKLNDAKDKKENKSDDELKN